MEADGCGKSPQVSEVRPSGAGTEGFALGPRECWLGSAGFQCLYGEYSSKARPKDRCPEGIDVRAFPRSPKAEELQAVLLASLGCSQRCRNALPLGDVSVSEGEKARSRRKYALGPPTVNRTSYKPHVPLGKEQPDRDTLGDDPGARQTENAGPFAQSATSASFAHRLADKSYIHAAVRQQSSRDSVYNRRLLGSHTSGCLVELFKGDSRGDRFARHSRRAQSSREPTCDPPSGADSPNRGTNNPVAWTNLFC